MNLSQEKDVLGLLARVAELEKRIDGLDPAVQKRLKEEAAAQKKKEKKDAQALAKAEKEAA